MPEWSQTSTNGYHTAAVQDQCTAQTASGFYKIIGIQAAKSPAPARKGVARKKPRQTDTGKPKKSYLDDMDAQQVMDLIKKTDYNGLRSVLEKYPALANEPLPLDDNPETAHPLHRICDGVFNGTYSDNAAFKMAAIFIACGASVDGNVTEQKKDTPLIAAASLHADEVALLYIDHGANILHPGCHGGTALHWAAWCGRKRVVKRLIGEKMPLNKICIDFKGTPLLWAVHGYKFGGSKNKNDNIECARLLLHAGADRNIPNGEGTYAWQFLDDSDVEMKGILTGA